MRDLAERALAVLRWETARITLRGVLLACVLAILAIGIGVGVGISLGAASPAEGVSLIEAAAPIDPAPVPNQLALLGDPSLTTHSHPAMRVKCPECGVVESWRELAAQGGAENRAEAGAKPIKAYEITLRMKDGSSHRFVDASPANWRPGQRIILISGGTGSAKALPDAASNTASDASP
jgi:hypothetical protein